MHSALRGTRARAAGSVPDTTNNRMELVAAIEGLRALKRACQVTVLTDSEYVKRGITEFLPRSKTNGSQSAAGKRSETGVSRRN